MKALSAGEFGASLCVRPSRRRVREQFCEHRLTHFLKLAYNPPSSANRMEFGRGRFVLVRHFTVPQVRRQGGKLMTDHNQSNSTLNQSNSTLIWIAAGTGAAVLGAAILFQCFRPQPGTAAEETAGRAGGTNSTTGKTRLGTTANPQTAAPAGVTKANWAGRVSYNGKVLVVSMDEVAEESINKVGKDVLDGMLNRAMIQLACQERGIEVTAAEVDQEIVRIATEFKIPVEQYLEMLRAERNISPQQYRKEVIWPMLALKKLAGADVSVTDREIQTAFEREYGPRVKVRMILFDNLRRAQAAWPNIKEHPENFEKYVQEFSIDPNSKSLDGSVPPIPRHSGSDNVEQAAFKLKSGEISAIVQLNDTMNRYVILKCEGRTDPIVQERDKEVDAELADQIKKQKTQELVTKVFKSIQETTRVDNQLTNSTTGGTKPGNASRVDGTKPAGVRSTTKGSSTNQETGEVRPAASKGTPTKLVKPAAATSDDDRDVAPPPRPAARRPAANSAK